MAERREERIAHWGTSAQRSRAESTRKDHGPHSAHSGGGERSSHNAQRLDKIERTLESLKQVVKDFRSETKQQLEELRTETLERILQKIENRDWSSKAVETGGLGSAGSAEIVDSSAAVNSTVNRPSETAVEVSNSSEDSDIIVEWASCRPVNAAATVAAVATGVRLTSRAAIGWPDSEAAADEQEMCIGNLPGLTYPSLAVQVKPSLSADTLSQESVARQRANMERLLRAVLTFNATKFTEWLIQTGLIRLDPLCHQHSAPLKLAMYSDVSKLPLSGGYVLVCECCPGSYVSVFSGSIFEGAPHPPTVLLKLIYHWCCQTNIASIVQWVKVDNLYIKNFFTNMRAVCTAAIRDKFEKIGGPTKRVEVGVVGLGLRARDGKSCRMSVEVLGAMDPESKLVRLSVVESAQAPAVADEKYKQFLSKILKPLDSWVDKSSTVVIDRTVDKATLHKMGFQSVYQGPEERGLEYTNANVMRYLSQTLPAMFKGTLRLLSVRIIQQFLDELVWRERWGPAAPQAYKNIIVHIAEQTRRNDGSRLLHRLQEIAANPFAGCGWEEDGDPEAAAYDTGGAFVLASKATTAQRPASSAGGDAGRCRKRAAGDVSNQPGAPPPAQARRTDCDIISHPPVILC